MRTFSGRLGQTPMPQSRICELHWFGFCYIFARRNRLSPLWDLVIRRRIFWVYSLSRTDSVYVKIKLHGRNVHTFLKILIIAHHTFFDFCGLIVVGFGRL